jgi:hypothetical protein
MLRAGIIVGLALVFLVTASASGPDKRLATISRAYVVAIDTLAEDVPVAKCLARHLAEALPIAAVATKEEADVVFRVRANLPGATARVMLGGFGGSPSAHLYVELPNGTKLWDDGAKLRRALGKGGKLESANGDETVECGLADELLGTLRDAMKKARDGK